MTARSRIFVVDDELNIREALVTLLEKRHYNVGGAASAEEALEQLETSPADLVLTDLKMPRADGFEVLDWVRAQPELRNLFIVVMSSSAQERDMSRAQALGARSYLAKFPVASDLTSIYHVANSMTTVAELDRLMPPLR